MPQKPTIPRTCQQCGEPFLARLQVVKDGKGKYCSPACQHLGSRVPPIIRACEQCGEGFETDIGRINAGSGRFCSQRCAQRHRVENSEHGPNWRGGRSHMGDPPYWYIYKPEHPYATKTGYVLESRLVMEAHLGRYLTPDEDVHHVSKNRDDNDISNLRLMSSVEHSRMHATEDMTDEKKAKMWAGRMAKAAQERQA